jgi:hypothetical protein
LAQSRLNIWRALFARAMQIVDSVPARTREGVIWMLTIYAKSEEQTIPAHVLRKIREEIDG